MTKTKNKDSFIKQVKSDFGIKLPFKTDNEYDEWRFKNNCFGLAATLKKLNIKVNHD